VCHTRTQKPHKVCHNRTQEPHSKVCHTRTQEPHYKVRHTRTQEPPYKVCHKRTQEPDYKVRHTRTQEPHYKVCHKRTHIFISTHLTRDAKDKDSRVHAVQTLTSHNRPTYHSTPLIIHVTTSCDMSLTNADTELLLTLYFPQDFYVANTMLFTAPSGRNLQLSRSTNCGRQPCIKCSVSKHALRRTYKATALALNNTRLTLS